MKRQPHLILTVDYELFGDGSGCLDACVLQPAEKMMQIADRFDAPLTFFSEALEFIAFDKHANDRRAIEQLRGALKRGHDVQLHLHPQWHGARLDATGIWRLDMERWRIGDLPEEMVRALIRKGKQWLESDVAANSPGYRCHAFRAGGWCIQPSFSVVPALRAEGFVLDSTVAPRQWRAAGQGEWSDFRAAPELPYWRTTGDVCQTSTEGLWEVPIVTGNIGRWRHLTTLLSAKQNIDAGMAPGCAGSYRGPAESKWNRIYSRAVRLQQLGSVLLDISTLPAEELIHVTRQWVAQHVQKNDMPLPIVAIAHTKNFTRSSELAMAEYLEWAKREGIVISTYGGWLASHSVQGSE